MDFYEIIMNCHNGFMKNKHVNKDIHVKIQARTRESVLQTHIKTKQDLLRVKPVRLGRTILNKDKLVAKHVNLDIHVKMQARTSKNVLPAHIKTKQVLLRVKTVMQENMDLVVKKVKHQKMKHVLNVIPARFPQKDRHNVQHA